MADSILRLKVESQEYDQKIKRAAEGIQKYASECRKVGGTLEYVEKETLDFVRGLGRMDTVSKTAKGSLGEMTKAFTDLKMQYKQMTDAEKQSPFGRELNNSLNQLEQRIVETKRDLKGIEGELSGSKFGQFGSIIDTIGQKMGVTGNLTEMLTSRAAMMTAGMGAVATAVGMATKKWAEYNAELSKQDHVTQVTTGLKGPDADRMTDVARAMVDTYKVDFREAINAANTLMSQFGTTGDEAMKIIKDGMQGMIQGDGPKLLTMIQQYAPAFRDAGVSARQLVAVIQNSEGGIFTDQNMNAIVMGIKNIRLMTKATSDALAKLGINGQQMTKQLNEGTLTIFEALKQVSSQLKNTEAGSQAAGEVMQQVFGRQGVTAGTNLAKAIETLNTNLDETKKQTGELGDAFAELQTANEKLNTAIREAFGYDGWEQMAKGIESKLIKALATVIEQLGKIRKLFHDFTPEGQTENIQTAEQKDMNRRLAYVRSGSNKQYWNQQNKEYYDQQVSDRRYKVLSLRGDDAITRGLRQKAEADLKAWENLRDEYNKKANAILTAPPKTTTPGTTTPTNPTNPTTTTSHVKTEEQKNNEAIQKLTQEYLKASDERRVAIRAEIKDLQDRNKEIKRLTQEATGTEAPTGSLKALGEELKKLQDERQLLNDPIAIEVQDQAIRDVQAEIDELNGKKVTISVEPKVNMTPFEHLQQSIRIQIAEQNIKVDTNALQNVMKVAVQNGINSLNPDFTSIQEQIREGFDIPAETWREVVDKMNKELKDRGFGQISLNLDTGNVKEEKKRNTLEDSKKLVSGLSSVASGLQQMGIELPQEVQAVMGFVQGLMTVIEGVQTIISMTQTPAIIANTVALSALTSAMAVNTMSNFIPFARGGVVPHAANGFAGMVPGNHFSGDVTPIMANAGEVVLNRAQAGVLANQLEGGGQRGGYTPSHVSGEQIWIALNAYTRRTGKGELVTWR